MSLATQTEKPRNEAILPPVTAQIFASSQESKELIANVSNTIYMKYVNWTASGDNIDEAISYLSKADSSQILIIEKDRPLTEFLYALEALAEKCGEHTRVFVFGKKSEEPDPVSTYQKMREVGVTDFILMPASLDRFSSSLIDVFQSDARPKLGTSTAFIGAGSGNGSSTIAQNVGFAMAHVLECETLLVDLDPQYGTLAINFNLQNPHDLVSIEHNAGSIDHKVLWQSAEKLEPNFRVLPTLPDLNHAPDFIKSIVCSVLEIPFHQKIHVIIDVPDPWTDTKREMLSRVDRIVLICEPTLTGVQNLKNTKNALDELGIDAKNVFLVLNRTNQPHRSEISSSDVESLTGLIVVASLPYDARLLGEADAAGVPPIILSEEYPFSRAIIGLAREVAGMKTKGTTGIIKKILRRLRAWW